MEEDYGRWSSDDEFYDDFEEGFQERDEIEFSGSNGDISTCKVITKESLLAAQKDDLQRVMELLSLKEHHARTLLIHYCWDVDKVFTVFVEKGKERLYAEAGVPVLDRDNLINSCHFFSKVSCEICYEEFAANETTTMDCGHCFCNGCWTEHFIVKINEGQSRRITCMAYRCYSICDEGSIRYLVSARDPQLAEKFDRFLLESYIEDNRRAKWCPSVPHCGNAVRVDSDEYCEVECACGVQFCFSCSSEAHSPCSCLMWELWARKCKDESENVKWISENTKICPRCHKPVLKNGGCNLVVCICGQQFCWLCGGASGRTSTWTSIANHDCGRYKVEHDQKTECARLLRYNHYYKRYKAHMDSLKAEEENLKEKLQENIPTLELRKLTTKDYSWVSNGFHILTRSRKFLLYSYPFTYYVFGDELVKNIMSSQEKKIKQNLFEDQQQQLEANIERLSMVLEEPFEDYPEDKVSEIRTRIITLSAVIDKFCEELYDSIDNELLGPVEKATHKIAPYRSKGIRKASELADGFSTKFGMPEPNQKSRW